MDTNPAATVDPAAAVAGGSAQHDLPLRVTCRCGRRFGIFGHSDTGMDNSVQEGYAVRFVCECGEEMSIQFQSKRSDAIVDSSLPPNVENTGDQQGATTTTTEAGTGVSAPATPQVGATVGTTQESTVNANATCSVQIEHPASAVQSTAGTDGSQVSRTTEGSSHPRFGLDITVRPAHDTTPVSYVTPPQTTLTTTYIRIPAFVYQGYPATSPAYPMSSFHGEGSDMAQVAVNYGLQMLGSGPHTTFNPRNIYY